MKPVVRTGIDMVFLPRFTQVCSRYGERFLTRIYTDAERQICAGRSASLAARWAGKESKSCMTNSTNPVSCFMPLP
jgi:holo-[acyl-carrier protein] synthase